MLMKSLNEALLERKVDAQYATLMVLLWEPRLRRVTLSNAGAEPLLVCRNGEILASHAEGVPIGLLDHQQYEEFEHYTEPGDTLLLFSDGIEDQLNAEEHSFSRLRLQKLLREDCATLPPDLVNRIFTEVDEFRGNLAITDDQTVVALRVSH